MDELAREYHDTHDPEIPEEIDGRGLQPLVQALQLPTHLRAHLGVEV
jgi:hypothetical protein